MVQPSLDGPLVLRTQVVANRRTLTKCDSARGAGLGSLANKIFPTLTGRDHAPDADDGDGGLMLPF
jgi:hypothetical protein